MVIHVFESEKEVQLELEDVRNDFYGGRINVYRYLRLKEHLEEELQVILEKKKKRLNLK